MDEPSYDWDFENEPWPSVVYRCCKHCLECATPDMHPDACSWGCNDGV